MNIIVHCLLIILHPFESGQNFKIENHHFTTDPIISTTTNDSTEMVKTIKDFFYWYKKNYKKAGTFIFTYTDNNGNYQVDMNICNNYLRFLKSSGYLSDEYIKLWSKYFSDGAAKFKQFPQNEGPPEGFDFDMVLISQESTLVLNDIHKFKYDVIELKDNKAVVQIIGTFSYIIDLTKINRRWKIDYIATENYD